MEGTLQTFAIVGDVQAPYHDRKAFEVCCKILEDVKPQTLVVNGDWGDYRTLALRYPTVIGDALISDMREELERQQTLLKELVTRAGAKRKLWSDGNHEWRVERNCQVTPQLSQLMGITTIRDALAIPSLLGLYELGFKYSGTYPAGCWLLDDASAEDNVYVEHGFITRKHSGYTGKALADDRLTNVVIGHCERLAGPNWKKVVGVKKPRYFFSVEGGSLSIIGQRSRPVGVYTGIPHSQPDYINNQQGFTVIYHDSGHWQPYTIGIQNGHAIFQGKIYKS